MRQRSLPKFRCPGCGEYIAAPVIDTQADYRGLKRRRYCESCGIRFVTFEKLGYIVKATKA